MFRVIAYIIFVYRFILWRDSQVYDPDLEGVTGHIHNVFHVSYLRKYIQDPSHIIDYEPIEIRGNMRYEELPVEIIDHREQKLRTKVIPLVKVICGNHEIEEVT